MALKLNIRPEIEEEMEHLLPKLTVRSKTEYINRAIKDYNQKLKREMEIARLRRYFETYRKEGQAILDEFARLRSRPD